MKLFRFSSLQTEIQAKEWCYYNFAVEVGAPGVKWLLKVWTELSRLVRDSGEEAAHCTRWIYVLSRSGRYSKEDWSLRVNLASRGTTNFISSPIVSSKVTRLITYAKT